MKLSITEEQLINYVCNQLNNCFPDPYKVICQDLEPYLPKAIERLRICFSEIKLKYFLYDNQVYFDHLHSDHYAMFLYILSHVVYTQGDNINVASKLYLLNKQLHGLDAYFQINLPSVFLFVHPVGTVLGNAIYGNYFTVYQNCTVGSGESGVYPEFGEGVIMYAKSTVIGRAKIGNNVVIGANTFILNQSVSNNTIVTPGYPDNNIKENLKHFKNRKFGHSENATTRIL